MKRTHSGHFLQIHTKARKKDFKQYLEVLIFLMVELDRIELTTS